MRATLDTKTALEMLDSVRDAGPNAVAVAVAVDGSHESRHALEWAVSHAERHGLVIRVVTTHSTLHAAIDHPMPITIFDVDAAEISRERAAAVDVLGDTTDGGIGFGHRQPIASPVKSMCQSWLFRARPIVRADQLGSNGSTPIGFGYGITPGDLGAIARLRSTGPTMCANSASSDWIALTV